MERETVKLWTYCKFIETKHDNKSQMERGTSMLLNANSSDIIILHMVILAIQIEIEVDHMFDCFCFQAGNCVADYIWCYIKRIFTINYKRNQMVKSQYYGN